MEDGTSAVALVTACGYLMAFTYEIGYFARMDIPFSFIKIEIENVLTAATLCIPIFLVMVPSLEKSEETKMEKFTLRWGKHLLSTTLFFLLVYYFVQDNKLSVVLAVACITFLAMLEVMPMADNSVYWKNIIFTMIFPAILGCATLTMGVSFADMQIRKNNMPFVTIDSIDYTIVRAYSDYILTTQQNKDGSLQPFIKPTSIDELIKNNQLIHMN